MARKQIDLNAPAPEPQAPANVDGSMDELLDHYAGIAMRSATTIRATLRSTIETLTAYAERLDNEIEVAQQIKRTEGFKAPDPTDAPFRQGRELRSVISHTVRSIRSELTFLDHPIETFREDLAHVMGAMDMMSVVDVSGFGTQRTRAFRDAAARTDPIR